MILLPLVVVIFYSTENYPQDNTTMRKPNITAKQYHSTLANKTARPPKGKSRKMCRLIFLRGNYLTCQSSVAYWRIVLSELNVPAFAVFLRHFLPKATLSEYSWLQRILVST